MTLKDYRIYGHAGIEGDTLLEDFHLVSEAIDWAKRYCRNDLGGYLSVYVTDKDGAIYWEKDD